MTKRSGPNKNKPPQKQRNLQEFHKKEMAEENDKIAALEEEWKSQMQGLPRPIKRERGESQDEESDKEEKRLKAEKTDDLFDAGEQALEEYWMSEMEEEKDKVAALEEARKTQMQNSPHPRKRQVVKREKETGVKEEMADNMNNIPGTEHHDKAPFPASPSSDSIAAYTERHNHFEAAFQALKAAVTADEESNAAAELYNTARKQWEVEHEALEAARKSCAYAEFYVILKREEAILHERQKFSNRRCAKYRERRAALEHCRNELKAALSSVLKADSTMELWL